MTFLVPTHAFLHIFTANTPSKPPSPVLYHSTQSSLPLFNWKTFCLLVPNHMMGDKCLNPYLWAFKDCDIAFTRQLFDSKMDKLQTTVGLHHGCKVTESSSWFLGRVNNDTQTWKQTELECTLQGVSRVQWTGVTVVEHWCLETPYKLTNSESCQPIILPDQGCRHHDPGNQCWLLLTI